MVGAERLLTPIHIPVLDKGYVVLDNCMANDLDVVNAARASFGKASDFMGDKEKGIINFMMRDVHTTPFEHSVFRFIIKAPIFVAREWMRHRWSSFNEYSLRYAPAIMEFYLPEPKNIRKQIGKVGAYTFEPVTDEDKQYHVLSLLDEVYVHAEQVYHDLTKAGLAKELARLILPVGLYTSFYWTVNAHSIMNFISLRAADTAQYEIRQYAKVIEQLFAERMPETYKAFINNGRKVPQHGEWMSIMKQEEQEEQQLS